jgi:hypothetical protein
VPPPFPHHCPANKYVTGHPSTEYVSEETPMAAYANLHIAFEQMRVRALRAVHGSPDSEDDSSANTDPPRVLVLGPENSGKTTVCKILTNYAVRAGQDWSPLLVNVDPSDVRVVLFPSPVLVASTESSRVAGPSQGQYQYPLCILHYRHVRQPIHLDRPPHLHQLHSLRMHSSPSSTGTATRTQRETPYY